MRLALAVFLLLPGLSAAQSVPFDSERWSFYGAEYRLEEHLGQPALFLLNAHAVLEDVDLAKGAIEFDIAFSPARGFSGATFHRHGAGNFEQFYLRPHQSGNPDASQYQPVFSSVAAWQIYHGKQFAAQLVHKFDTWQHVRIEFLEDRAAVYVDSKEPVLIIGSLDRREPGGAIGLQSGFAPAHFANFRYEVGGDFVIERPATAERDGTEDEIQVWDVSTAFDESLILVDSLEEFPGSELNWTKLQVESNGIANLARTVKGRQPNTVLARFTIEAEKPVRRAFEFGYSDRARVFLNGRLVYIGNRKYQSQDYRFLGTVGLHDALVLDLQARKNEIVIAVSEDFGGWAVVGRITKEDNE